jgi:steroid delta-isomerase-like uncharacterized protein
MSEQSKTIVRRLLEDAFNGRDVTVIDDVVAFDFTNQHPPFPGLPPGSEGIKQVFRVFWSAFPDVRATIEDLVAEADKVAAFATLEGTHEGELAGLPPTGRRVHVPVIEIFRVSDGKIRERWGVVDQMGLMQQLGVLPGTV